MPDKQLEYLGKCAESAMESVSDSMLTSQDSIDQLLGNYLRYYFAAHHGPDPGPLAILGLTLKKIESKEPIEESDFEAFSNDRRRALKKWGAHFIAGIFVELRAILCGAAKKPTPLGPTSQAALAALAAFIAQKLGISNATAMGIAVLIFLSLGRATKNSFCKLTDPKHLDRYFGQL